MKNWLKAVFYVLSTLTLVPIFIFLLALLLSYFPLAVFGVLVAVFFYFLVNVVKSELDDNDYWSNRQ